MGGAHGLGNSSFFTYSVKENKVLGFEDFFKPDTQEELKKLLNKKVRAQNGITQDLSLQEADFEGNCFIVDEIKFTDNFYPSSKGVTFHYNSYEVQAYAFGPYEITLSWEELEGVLK